MLNFFTIRGTGILLSRRNLLFSICVFSSCTSIHVNHGPFQISEDTNKLEEKSEYLKSIEGCTLKEENPNILLILVDDLGKYDLHLYDSLGVITPNIERLAHDGVLFNNAFTSSPVCSPSRAALLSGRYQQRFGYERQPMNRYARNRLEYFVVDHFVNVDPMRLISPMADVSKEEIEKQGIPDEELLLPEILQHAGYRTGLCGKWHLGNADKFHPDKHGFDYHYGFYEAFTLYSPEKTAGIEEHRHDYFANKHIWRQGREGSSAIRINDSIVEEEEYLTFAIARESINFLKHQSDKPFFLLSAFNAPHTPFQVPEEYFNRYSDIPDHNKRVYYAMISALDDAIGMILDALEETGLDTNTIIIFASDNGGATYTGATDNGPLMGGKFSQFEGGINIPMIMQWKGNIRPGQVYSKQVSLMDIFPTAIEASKIPPTEDRKTDGIDLIKLLDSPEQTSHEYLFWRTDYNKAIRSEEWKMIWNTRDEQVFLYDISENNFERKNVAGENSQVIGNLKKIYEEWEKEMKEPLWPGVMEIKFDIDGIETWWAI